MASFADITGATVQPDAGSLVFRAEVAAPLPETLKISSLESEIADFPEGFEWSLATTIRAFRNETDSPAVRGASGFGRRHHGSRYAGQRGRAGVRSLARHSPISTAEDLRT